MYLFRFRQEQFQAQKVGRSNKIEIMRISTGGWKALEAYKQFPDWLVKNIKEACK